MKTIDEYAVELVVSGARSCAEDDLNEDGEIADDQHETACDLALEVVRTIESHPAEFLAWYRSVTCGDGGGQ